MFILIAHNRLSQLLIFGLVKACVLYILRVGVTDQMTEPTQRSFIVFLAKQVWQMNYSNWWVKLTFSIILPWLPTLYDKSLTSHGNFLAICSFSLLMLVLPCKLLLYVLYHTLLKHWGRWVFYRLVHFSLDFIHLMCCGIIIFWWTTTKLGTCFHMLPYSEWDQMVDGYADPTWSKWSCSIFGVLVTRGQSFPALVSLTVHYHSSIMPCSVDG